MLSDEGKILVDQYREMHQKEKKFKGKSTLRHAEKITGIISRTGSHSILDYGCGKGCQYDEHNINKNWNCVVHRYDPGIEKYSVIPVESADGVICIDVLEHILKKDLDHVFSEIFGIAQKFVYLCIAIFPSRKSLPDGRNCHVSLLSVDEWLSYIKKHNKKKIDCYVSFRAENSMYDIVV